MGKVKAGLPRRSVEVFGWFCFRKSLLVSTPPSPVLWNHEVRGKSRKNPRAAIGCGQNLANKGVSPRFARDEKEPYTGFRGVAKKSIEKRAMRRWAFPFWDWAGGEGSI